jgi:DNA-binding MarR family transcriptional regulator
LEDAVALWLATEFLGESTPARAPTPWRALCFLAPTMISSWFLMKRAHLTSLRYARTILKPHRPLTPARVDLMTAIARAPGAYLPQAVLTRNLGLHHSTVSKMLKRMEELDLVMREIDRDDERIWLVCLTARGEALLREAQQNNIDDGMAELLVDIAVAPHRRGAPAKSEVRRTNGVLRRYAVTLYDTAIALYAPSPPLPASIAA